MAAAPLPPPRFENLNLLRAAAALAVVAYHVIEHARWSTFPTTGPLGALRQGWVGVDLFFVISGFVIAYSGILLLRADAARFTRAYWARRLSRILPLYLLTLALWIAFFRPGLFAEGFASWGWQLATHLTFTHSFWPDTHGALDGPNWSLAIEMQFYLAMALLMGWIDRTSPWRLAAAAIAISWAFRAAMFFAYRDQPGWVFIKSTQLPGMVDLFVVGIVAAKWVLGGGALSTRRGIAWIAAAVVTGIACWTIYWEWAGFWDVWWMVTFWRTALAISFGCVLMAALHLPAVIARRWLRPFDALGEISYGLYLWHLFAVFWATRYLGHDGPRVLLVVLPLTLVLSTLSWHLLEKPFMRLVRPGSDPVLHRIGAQNRV